MQKVFIKYTFMIMTAAIFLILSINFLFSMHMLETQQFGSFHAKIEQMIHTLENNQEELSLLKDSLDEDYLTRARAAAYVLDRQPEVSLDVSEMQYLANLLNVDELHVIDENGIIVAASVSKYVGIDMADHKQTKAFLALLDTDDKDAYLIQDAQPNAAEGKIRQYVGVSRKAVKGIVQVGFTPTRQLSAQSRNTYEYIFSKFPTDIGEELFVVDATTGEMLGHSDGLSKEFDGECYELHELLDCTKGAYKTGNGTSMYVLSRLYEGVLLCAALPKHTLYQKLWGNILATFFYLIFIEAAVILLLNYLVKQKVIQGIHNIIKNLYAITKGNLDTTVTVGGNREFEELSKGINTMVKSIVSLSDRISSIIEISGIPLAAFEYEKGVQHVFVTSGLSGLLELPEKEAYRLYQNASLFDQYIKDIMKNPIDGEKEIFKIGDSRYIHIHMSQSQEGYLGIIADVTKDVTEKQQMQYENTHDPLTGLYKFGHFKELSEKILHQMPDEKLCAFVMMDLDHFKSINDTYGHDMGDAYLQGFAQVLKSMPQEHILSARRSGDEFCMMIYNCDQKKQILTYLNSFYSTLKEHSIKLSETESKVISASSGFAWTSDAKSSISQLLSHADEALYAVKKNTKGRYAEYEFET